MNREQTWTVKVGGHAERIVLRGITEDEYWTRGPFAVALRGPFALVAFPPDVTAPQAEIALVMVLEDVLRRVGVQAVRFLDHPEGPHTVWLQ